MHLGVYLAVDNLFVCTFGCFTPVSNFKAIRQLVMILHFKDLGDKESVVTNAAVLVPGESNFNGNVPQGGIYPHIKLHCNVHVLGINNVMPL